MTNDLFDPLIVVEELGTRKISGIPRRFVLCRCKCGKMFNARYDRMQSGKTKSCGCLKIIKSQRRAPNLKPEGMAAAHQVFSSYRQKCKTGKIPFEITFEEFVVICKRDCFYCSLPPSSQYKGWFVQGPRKGTRKVNGSFIYNGIDRIIPKNGYVTGNMRPCCYICNFAKNSNTETEFRIWAERLAAHLPKWECSPVS